MHELRPLPHARILTRKTKYLLGLQIRVPNRPIRSGKEVSKVRKLSQQGYSFVKEIQGRLARAIYSCERGTTRIAQSCCRHPQEIWHIEDGSIHVECLKCGRISEGIKI